MEASEALCIASEDGLGKPWRQVLDPWFIAKTCPHALLSVLAAVVSIYLLLFEIGPALERLTCRCSASRRPKDANPARDRGRGLSQGWQRW